MKELEARLAQVEDYLKEVNKATEDKADSQSPIQPDQPDQHFSNFNFDGEAGKAATVEDDSSKASETAQVPFDMPSFVPENNDSESFFNDAQLMGLGMTEALPPFEAMEELNTLFFKSMYYFCPVVHPARYLQAFYSGPLMKPPMCLQYAIWALAAIGNDKYDQYHEVFYRRARQYGDSDEMKGFGEHFITIGHAQAWALMASYEAKCMLFTRAAISGAKCVRLVNMMGLDRLDGDPDEVPPTLAAPMNWVELEERRRVFWGAFTIDAHASISTGWPNLVNSEDITTRLPAPEEAFITGRQEEAPYLHEVYQGANYSGFAGMVVICQVFKIILHHVHRSKPSDRPEDVMNGNFWMRHRDLDNKLSSLFMFLPEKLRLPQNIRDPAATHSNLNMHASIICLHHAAIEKVDKHNLPGTIKQTSIYRLRSAAEAIVNIIKVTSHTPSIFKSPLCALSLYCATTVYVYLAKQDPTSGLSTIDLSNLELIVRAMEAISRFHEITRAFLQQACLDIERNGLANSIQMPMLRKYREMWNSTDSSIPLIARSSISKHSEVMPVLPGRLPLNNPKGRLRPSTLRMDKPSRVQLDSKVDKIMRGLMNRDCFQAVLGAVTRNVAVPDEPQLDLSNHKRKRASPSPAPDMMNPFGLANPSSSNTSNFKKPSEMPNPIGRAVSSDHAAPKTTGEAYPWESLGVLAQGQISLALPDRTASSSASSPANQGFGTGTDTMSGSSHTSPGIGLGKTLEENRIDLRAFQNRIATPLWPTTEQGFFAQMTETIMSNSLVGEVNDPWGILDAEIDWSQAPGTG